MLPTHKGLNSKSGIAFTERHVRLKAAFKNKKRKKLFSMIIVHYSKIVTLLKYFKGKFVIEEDFIPPSHSLKPMRKLKELDLENKDIQTVF